MIYGNDDGNKGKIPFHSAMAPALNGLSFGPFSGVIPELSRRIRQDYCQRLAPRGSISGLLEVSGGVCFLLF